MRLKKIVSCLRGILRCCSLVGPVMFPSKILCEGSTTSEDSNSEGDDEGSWVALSYVHSSDVIPFGPRSHFLCTISIVYVPSLIEYAQQVYLPSLKLQQALLKWPTWESLARAQLSKWHMTAALSQAKEKLVRQHCADMYTHSGWQVSCVQSWPSSALQKCQRNMIAACCTTARLSTIRVPAGTGKAM